MKGLHVHPGAEPYWWTHNGKSRGAPGLSPAGRSRVGQGQGRTDADPWDSGAGGGTECPGDRCVGTTGTSSRGHSTRPEWAGSRGPVVCCG